MIVKSTDIPGLKKHITGKVRDVYDLGDRLLVVATDRLSAFDVVMNQGIPDKGRVLTQLSLFWFDLTKDIVENHLITADVDEIVEEIGKAGVSNPKQYRELLEGRSMIVTKAQPFPIECVVRGYLSGSAWKEYTTNKGQGNGTVTVQGIELPSDLVESSKLPKQVFTPSTKATDGHDLNITHEEAADIVGQDKFNELESKTIGVYQTANEYAATRGIIIADTKFEFGIKDGRIILIDEVLTPDSSRFWDEKIYEPGKPQPSFDKQYVRDYLETLDWPKTYPAPDLPDEIVARTSEKYKEAYRRIVGKELP